MKEYLKIETQYTENFNLLKSKKNKLSNIRLICFLLSAVLFYYYTSTDNYVFLASCGIFFIGFLILVVKSSKVSDELQYITQALEVIESIKKEDRVDDFENLEGDTLDNVYNKDLDIITGNSIFNRVNKTQSFVGNFQLKSLLSSITPEKEYILKRQEAFKELSSKPEWMVKFLTLSKRANIGQFVIFGEIKRVFNSTRLQILPLVVGGINLVTFITLASVGFPKKAVFFWVIIAIPVGFIINFIFKNKINTSLSYLFVNADQIENLLKLFKHVEDENFSSELNLKIKEQLISDGKKASELIKDVKSTIEGLEAIGFPIIGFLLNQFTLWKLFHAIQFEHRIEKVIAYNEKWVTNLATLEAYQSFAIYNSKYENFTTPQISDSPYHLEIIDAYHPLLAENIAVRNSFTTSRPNNIAIITGANMAGKSTFLRTVGTNLILAMNGANVSAKQMEFYPMELFTSIKTVDNLSSGDSYFKNEINKLKILIDRLEKGIPQYIILDEILKGTNSQDKLVGSKKFLEKLMHHHTPLVCFIATHDLDLTKMEEEYPDHVINYCFELKNVDSNYFSDYRLIQGTTQVMNAIFLMKQFRIID